MKKIFSMYGGLKREVYILCFGRFVTAMGGLIWPMLTLILKSKLGLDADEVAFWFLIFGIIEVPFGLLGGKIADRYNKRNMIIIFDLITVSLFITTAFLPLSMASLCVYFAGSLFQSMEWMAYDALIAELTTHHEREKAYSLQYLASNLGVIIAPTLGGILFNTHLWLCFLISGLAILSSTILISIFVPKNMEMAEITNEYEEEEEGTLGEVMKTRKLLWVYVVIGCLSAWVYNQFNYLLPIQMDDMFSLKGAMYFGMLTSINGAVVIFFTPILTQATLKWDDLKRVRTGVFLKVIGICSCCFYKNQLALYIISMVIFTLGEILSTLGTSPYISKRMPASHRARFTSINHIVNMTVASAGNTIIGKLVVLYSLTGGWIFVFGLGVILLVTLTFYRRADKKRFGLLYE